MKRPKSTSYTVLTSPYSEEGLGHIDGFPGALLSSYSSNTPCIHITAFTLDIPGDYHTIPHRLPWLCCLLWKIPQHLIQCWPHSLPQSHCISPSGFIFFIAFITLWCTLLLFTCLVSILLIRMEALWGQTLPLSHSVLWFQSLAVCVVHCRHVYLYFFNEWINEYCLQRWTMFH